MPAMFPTLIRCGQVVKMMDLDQQVVGSNPRSGITASPPPPPTPPHPLPPQIQAPCVYKHAYPPTYSHAENICACNVNGGMVV